MTRYEVSWANDVSDGKLWGGKNLENVQPGSCFQRKKERKERKGGKKGRKVKDFFAPGVVPATFGD